MRAIGRRLRGQDQPGADGSSAALRRGGDGSLRLEERDGPHRQGVHPRGHPEDEGRHHRRHDRFHGAGDARARHWAGRLHAGAGAQDEERVRPRPGRCPVARAGRQVQVRVGARGQDLRPVHAGRLDPGHQAATCHELTVATALAAHDLGR